MVDSLVSALDELLSRGPGDDNDPTIESVSERAGVAMGSFYEYFSSKDSLLGVLIGKVTRRNFENLAREVEQRNPGTLKALTKELGGVITRTYLEHPKQFRTIVHGAGRLGLVGLISRERDRFADVLRDRALAYLPDESPSELAETMRIAADAAMGVIVGEGLRMREIDLDAVSQEVGDLAFSIIARRHPAALDR